MESPRLLSVVSSSIREETHEEKMYSVSFPVLEVVGQSGDSDICNVVRLCPLSDFIALARAVRRQGRNLLEAAPRFPLRRFKKMSPFDDLRTHTKTISLVNNFLEFCHQHAPNAVWWQAFLHAHDDDLHKHNSCGDEDLQAAQIGAGQRQLQARMWNQYFTPSEDARAVVGVAEQILHRRKVKFWIEPAAGAGDICRLFPENGSKRICIDIDPALCAEHGWLNGNFLELSQMEIFGKRHIETKDAVVCTNPPFVAYNENKGASCRRDGKLAHEFIRHSLDFADVCVFLLPERFAREEERLRAIHDARGHIVSTVHGEVRRIRFNLGTEHFKTITQPAIIVSFERLKK